jgi:hypothetical protein
MATTKTFFLAAVVVSLASSPSLALHFSDGQVHDINYEIEDNVYVDRDAPGMRTIVNLLDGGRIMRQSGSLEAHEDSRINIFGGAIEDDVWIYDSSQVNMSGGSIGWGLATYGASQVNISGGSIGVGLPGHGTQGEVHILTVVNGLWACAASEVNISGGSIEHDVWIYDSSRVSISGGSIDGDLVLTSSGLLTIHGSDFAVNGQPVGYGGVSSIYRGGPYDEPRRHLSGLLANGTAIDNDFYIGYEAAIVLVPEACESPALLYVDDNAPNDPAPGDPAGSDPCEDGSMEHPYDAIQEGIDSLCHTGAVLVADGTYTGDGNRDIDFLGKAITVRSQNGPETCIIDCQRDWEHNPRGFYFHLGENVDSVVEGFTITNGYAHEGGGIYCAYSSPTITNNTITANWADLGGGIYCDSSSPIITDNIIAANQYGRGAAIACLNGSSPVIENNMIVDNWASEVGGIYCQDSQMTIRRNTIEHNIGEGGVGAMGCYECSAMVVNNLIVGNDSGDDFGGGIEAIESSLVITNCTIANNTGGGIKASDQPITITNCIVRNNGPWPIGGGVTVRYSNIEGGYDGPGNIDAEPCFVRPGYWTWYPFGWFGGDYHLKSQAGRWDTNEGRWTIDDVTSPCIDAGDPMSPIGREPFPNGGIINMGAYGGTAEASKSYFGEPPCQTIVAGDINGDCEVNFKDLAIMGLHWLDIPDPDDYVPSL